MFQLLLCGAHRVSLFVLQTPHLVNLNEDPLMSECLLYYIKEGVTRSDLVLCLMFNVELQLSVIPIVS